MATEVDQDCFSRLESVHVSLRPLKADMPGILSTNLFNLPSITIHEQDVEASEASACFARCWRWAENPIVLVVQISDQPGTAFRTGDDRAGRTIHTF